MLQVSVLKSSKVNFAPVSGSLQRLVRRFYHHESINAANTVPFGDTRNVMYGSVGRFEPVTIVRSAVASVAAGAEPDRAAFVFLGDDGDS